MKRDQHERDNLHLNARQAIAAIERLSNPGTPGEQSSNYGFCIRAIEAAVAQAIERGGW